MTKIGFNKFHLVSYYKGARIGHRMAVDAGEKVKSLTLMDIVPRRVLLKELKQGVALAYYH